MNRNDILKKCVDRGVADETDIGAVSHLFYVYLLSALQRGQRVEVPEFGTFGTRIVGVKRQRKMPFFEPSKELADKVNERYRELTYLVIGKYVMAPAAADIEYAGSEAPPDELVDRVDTDTVLDTHHEVSVEEYLKAQAARRRTILPQEETVMPKLNLKDEGLEGEPGGFEPGQPMAAPPTLRDVGGGGGGVSPLLLVALIVVLLAAGVFALNYFHVVNLWGKKTPKVAEVLPEAVPGPTAQAPAATDLGTPPGEQATPLPEVTPTPTPTPTPAPKAKVTPAPKPETKPAPEVAPAPKPELPASTQMGTYTVQVSSWASAVKAEKEVERFKAAGLDAFVESGDVGGQTWHRVRIGRYSTLRDAKDALDKLRDQIQDGLWVAKLGSR